MPRTWDAKEIRLCIQASLKGVQVLLPEIESYRPVEGEGELAISSSIVLVLGDGREFLIRVYEMPNPAETT